MPENNKFECRFSSLLIVIAPMIFFIVFAYEQFRRWNFENIASNLLAAFLWVVICIPFLYMGRRRFYLNITAHKIEGVIGLFKNKTVNRSELLTVERKKYANLFDVIEMKKEGKTYRVYLFMFYDREEISRLLLS